MLIVTPTQADTVTLTVTEFLLLQSLAQRPGFVKSRDNLMDAAYDDQVYVDDRTIDSHIKRMRKKFREVDPEFDAIETLYGASDFNVQCAIESRIRPGSCRHPWSCRHSRPPDTCQATPSAFDETGQYREFSARRQ